MTDSGDKIDGHSEFCKLDQMMSMKHDPVHRGLCNHSPHLVLRTINCNLNLDLHQSDAQHLLPVYCVANESIRGGEKNINNNFRS